MKKKSKVFSVVGLIVLVCVFSFVGCGECCNCSKDLILSEYVSEEKGYSVSNDGVELDCCGYNNYQVKGVIPVADTELLSDFGFKSGETHIVSFKLSTEKQIDKDEFSIEITSASNTNTYDKTAIDGDNYIYILLAFDNIEGGDCHTINVKWNAEDDGTIYTICADDNLVLEDSNV